MQNRNFSTPFLKVSLPGYLSLVLLMLGLHLSAQPPFNSPVDSLQYIYDNSDPDTIDIGLINNLALWNLDVDPVKSMAFSREAREKSMERNSDIDLAASYNSLACGFLVLGEKDSASHFFTASLTLYEKMDDKRGLANVAGNLGHMSYTYGDLAKALDYYFQALRLFEELDFKTGISNQLSAVANVLMEQEKYEEALHYDSLALHMYRESGDDAGVALILGNMGNIYMDLEETELAIRHLNEAIQLFRNQGFSIGLARNLYNLATIYLDMGELPRSLEASSEALDHFERESYFEGVVYCIGNEGKVALKSYESFDKQNTTLQRIPGTQKELLNQAIRQLQKAVDLAIKIDHTPLIAEWSLSLSTAYQYKGDFAKALDQFQLHASLQDSLDKEANAVKIEQLITTREIEVRDKQIELDRLRLQVKRNERVYFGIGLLLLAGLVLFIYRNYINQKKANTELKATQAQLIESERQKENEILRRRISRDIHDDISSGLTKISWMTEVLKSRAGKEEQKVDVSTLDKIMTYSRDTVSKLGEIIWSTKPESDNVESLLSYMRAHLNSYLEGLPLSYEIQFPEHVPAGNMNPELRRNLFLVLKESVHNAVKYSQASHLDIQFRLEEENYLLVVSDNGVGFPSDTTDNKGNGLVNMKARMKAVGGRMKIDSEAGSGTILRFSGQLY